MVRGSFFSDTLYNIILFLFKFLPHKNHWINIILAEVSWQQEEWDDLDFDSASFQLENSLFYNNKEEDINVNFDLIPLLTKVEEEKYLKDLSLADFNELDLIEYINPVSPTPSSASSSSPSSCEQFLLSTNSPDQNNHHESGQREDVTVDPAVDRALTSIVAGKLVTNLHAETSTTMEERVAGVRLLVPEECYISRKEFVAEQSVSSEQNQQQSENKDLLFDDSLVHTSPENSSLYETDSSDSINERNSTSPPPSTPSPSQRKTAPSTRRERNNEASKRLRLKRKRQEDDLLAREALAKKQKQELEDQVRTYTIQTKEIYRSVKLLVSHFAQDNTDKFKQHLSTILDLHRKAKKQQDPVQTKVFGRMLYYFERASRSIRPEQQEEIMRWLTTTTTCFVERTGVSYIEGFLITNIR